MRQFLKTILQWSANQSRKKYLFLFVVLIYCFDCFAMPSPGSHVTQDSNKIRILIISSYNAQSIKARKNKKELFAELVTTLQNDLAAEISSKIKYEPIIISETIFTGDSNNISVLSIIKEHLSDKTIVIKAFDIWFEQTGVEVTEEEDGKKRTASFDICSNVMYELYNGNSIQQEKETKYREHFTERSVASGFLSVGPDIVGKRKHAIQIMKKNANAFMQVARDFLSAP